MIRHWQDFKSLIFISLNIFFLCKGLQSPVGSISYFLIPITAALSYISFIINHNQLHRGIFYSERLNILLNTILSIGTGLPVSSLYLPHVINHHPYACNKSDWAGAHLAGDRKGLWRILVYNVRAQIVPLKLRPRSPFQGLSRYRKISFVLEALSLVTFMALGLNKNPFGFFIHIMVPWFVSVNILVFMNFFLHDGCDYDSEINHSRTFTSKIGNFFLFNSGYHLAHHMKPKLHWTELPSYHANHLRGRFSPTQEHKSIICQFLAMYVFFPKKSKNEIIPKET